MQAIITKKDIKPEIIDYILSDHLESVDNPDSVIGSLLLHAVHDDNYNLAQVLLDKGASPSVRNTSNETALGVAAFLGLPEIAKLLIARGADVNEIIGEGMRAIHAAAGAPNQKEEHLQTVRILLDAGAVIRSEGDGPDPVKIAVLSENWQIAEEIVAELDRRENGNKC